MSTLVYAAAALVTLRNPLSPEQMKSRDARANPVCRRTGFHGDNAMHRGVTRHDPEPEPAGD
jgi:hypothetical protein